MSKLIELLVHESQELAHRFTKSRIEGRGTPQEVSDRREAVVKALLEKYFPFPHRIAKGNIVDSDNNQSASIDCIILSPDHPYTISDGSHFSVILADGVDFAIELKPDLTSRDELHRGLKQIASVKRLTKGRHGLVIVGESKVSPFYYKIPGIIFSNDAPTDVEVLLENITSYYEENSVCREHQFDVLFVNSRFLVINNNLNSYVNLADRCIPQGLVVAQVGDNSLAALFMLMHSMPFSAPKISEGVMSSYLMKQSPTRTAVWFEKYNSRLAAIEAQVVGNGSG